jgi:PHD/YefM family antitoxin component YafN of YafNO toxin-antitoxin module
MEDTRVCSKSNNQAKTVIIEENEPKAVMMNVFDFICLQNASEV